MTDIEQLGNRVAQLETVLRALYPEVKHLRAELDALRANIAGAPDAVSQTGAPNAVVPVASLARPGIEPLVSPAFPPAAHAVEGARRPRDSEGLGAPPMPEVSLPGLPTAATSPGGGPSHTATHEHPGPALPDAPPARPGGPHAPGARVGAPAAAAGADVESLVGRYGTLALATLMILLAAGAFVRWAIAQGLLGPVARVVLGVIAAALVAGIGLRFRDRGSRPFGYTLLSLALAILHVDVWGAGPVLHLVSSGVALGAAALASAALALLALADDEESIFCVGGGGALLAPFVAAADTTNVPVLLVYGYAVIAAAFVAVRRRRWNFSVTLLGVAVIVYTSAALVVQRDGNPGLGAVVPVAFALACAITGFVALSGVQRASMVQACLAAAWAAVVTFAGQGGPPEQVIASAWLAMAIAYATVPGLGEAPIQVMVGAVALPVGFLLAVIDAVPQSNEARAVLVGVWAISGATAGVIFDTLARATKPPRSARTEQTGAMLAAVSAVGEGAAAIILGLWGRDPAVGLIAIAAYATIVALIGIQRGWRTVLTTASVILGVAVVWSWYLLAPLPRFGALPFLTLTSVAAAVAAICTVVVGESVERAPRVLWTGAAAATVLARARVCEGLAVFMWLRMEFAHVGSSAISASLLVAYYAVTGVGAVLVGRQRRIPSLRHAGLALAVYAALKAMLEASQLSTGLRIASYLSAGIFLLTVAYWYRNAADRRPSDAAGTAGNTR